KCFNDCFVFYISMGRYKIRVGMGVILFPLFVSGGFYVAELDSTLQCLKREVRSIFIHLLRQPGGRYPGVGQTAVMLRERCPIAFTLSGLTKRSIRIVMWTSGQRMNLTIIHKRNVLFLVY
ncbi:TPA: hypothetical protein ACIBUM_004600, partial [Salmonella enterica subsp. enterica serovar Mississippi]